MSTSHAIQTDGRQPAQGPRDRLLAGLPVTDRRLDLAGISTAVLEGGDGPPVVLLHGAGEFGATWLRAIPALARTHRVIVPDLPGHGESGLPDGALDVDRVLAWLDELIDETCSAPPVLAGHLLGGAIMARHAAAKRRRIDRLILVDSMGLAPYRPSPKFALPMIGFIIRPTERSRDRMFRRCFVDLDGLREDVGEDWRALEEYALDRARSDGMKAALKAMMPGLGMPAIPETTLDRIAVPTTLIWGRHDLQIRLRVAEAASERHGWPLHVIEEAADDPAVEQPEAFLEAFAFALGGSRVRPSPDPRSGRPANPARGHG